MAIIIIVIIQIELSGPFGTARPFAHEACQSLVRHIRGSGGSAGGGPNPLVLKHIDFALLAQNFLHRLLTLCQRLRQCRCRGLAILVIGVACCRRTPIGDLKFGPLIVVTVRYIKRIAAAAVVVAVAANARPISSHGKTLGKATIGAFALVVLAPAHANNNVSEEVTVEWGRG